MRTKRIVQLIFTALVWLALMGGLLYQSCGLSRRYAGLSLRLESAPVSEMKLTKLMAGEGGDLVLTAAWSRGKTVAVTADELALSTNARPVSVYGDMRAVCPMTLLAGSFPVGDDRDGCVLTSDVAMALFHSVDAVGARVSAGGKDYVLRGVISAYEPMIVTRGGDAAAYENLEFDLTDLSGGAAEAKAFLYRHELGDAYAVVPSGLYARLLAGLVWLPAALVCLLAAWLCLRRYWPRRKSAAALWRLVPAAGFLALAWFILGRTFYWPQIYLPTKCSDFTFWRELWTGWRTSWKALSLTTPLPKDLQFYRSARLIVCGVCAALAIEVSLFRQLSRLR